MTHRTNRWSRRRPLAAVALVAAITLAACGGGSGGSEGGSGAGTASSGSDTASSDAPPATIKTGSVNTVPPEESSSASGSATGSETASATEAESETAPAEAASGTLRIVEYAEVSTFDPAGATVQMVEYLYPVYDTLTRQAADFSLVPNLATAWTSPEPTVWEFTLRDDVVFHDGSAFDAQVAADNMTRSAAFEGNPNSSAWTNMVSATAVDATTLRVEFSKPQPQFPLQMSMVMGMMISPKGLDTDLTRAPAGSGPWIWQESESTAGVTEVFTLNPDYWNPKDQGVERIEVTAVADNQARLNAVLTGEADVSGSTANSEVPPAKDGGLGVLSVPNFVAYIVITGRDGVPDEPLADLKVRQAIAYSVDREAYLEAVQNGVGDAKGGFYPSGLSEWYVPELDDTFAYDPAKARELLTEAGYPDGIEVTMPVMPALQTHLDLIVQMLGASGIKVTLDTVNNGELGARVSNREERKYGLSWYRSLVYHPADDLPPLIDENGRLNPGGLTDTADLVDKMNAAIETGDTATMQSAFAEVETEMVDRGILIPLAHGAQNVAYNQDTVTGLVMGLNMQGPMPYGVRVSN